MGNPILNGFELLALGRREAALAENIAYAKKHILKCQPVGIPVKKGTEFVEHIGVGDRKNMELHMQKLEQYLKQNPNDIEVRSQLAKLREVFSEG